MPTLTIVIGGNGAGKSTWCRDHRDELPRDFYDADSLAAGLGDWNSPAKQLEARELVDRAIQEHVGTGESFGFESTYSGRSRPRLVERAKADGYTVRAVFVGTRRPEINVPHRLRHLLAQIGREVPDVLRDRDGGRDSRDFDSGHPSFPVSSSGCADSVLTWAIYETLQMLA